MSNITHVSDTDFSQQVLESQTPVLVDFWAEWCGPCKMIAPILEELETHYGERLKICKLDVDANREMPVKYGVRGIPTLILFKGGEIVETKVGALSKSQLTEVIDQHIA